MDKLFAQYFTNPSSSTARLFISSSIPSSNIDVSQQTMDISQINNIHFSNNYEQPFPFPSTHPAHNYSTSYNPMHTIPSMNQPHEGYSFSLMGQSHVPFIIQTTPQLRVEREEDKKKIEAKRCKIAREQRKQILKTIRSKSASKFKEETSKRPSIYRETQERTPHVFYSPDGKRFEEILTKKLRKSDVKSYGRIVLPKREVEEKLPAPSREGIEVIFKDIYSGREWKLKLKYWINGKTRMYILENTGDMVNHYKLCMGDYLGLYKDELTNLYMCTKKACDLLPCADQGKEKEPSDLANQQIQSTNNLELNPPNQSVAQETNNTAMSPILVDGNDGGGDDDDEQQSSLDEFYESLDDIFDVY